MKWKSLIIRQLALLLILMAVLFTSTGFVIASPVVNGSGNASPVKITGKVTDDKGAPLPGVSVVVKGTSTGILTDIEGNVTTQVLF